SWKRRVRFRLVPERRRRNVILQRQIPALSFQIRSPAKCLDRYPQVVPESNRIHYMPAIHTKSLLAAIEPIRSYDLCQPGIRGTEHPILSGGMLEIPGAAKIVLRSRATNSRPLAVAIHVKFDFTLAPPSIIVHAPREVCPNVVPLPADPVNNRVNALIW